MSHDYSLSLYVRVALSAMNSAQAQCGEQVDEQIHARKYLKRHLGNKKMIPFSYYRDGTVKNNESSLIVYRVVQIFSIPYDPLHVLTSQMLEPLRI